MNTTDTLAIATSSATVSAMMAMEEAENEARRKSHKGSDQILIRTKKGSYEKVIEIISKLYGVAPAEKNGALKNPNPGFNFNAVIIFLIVGFIMLMLDAFYITEFSFVENFVITAVISLLYGHFARDDSFDSIEIKDDGEEVLTQIDIYNSSGYRNYSEIQILEIVKEFKKTGLIQKEN